MGVLVRQHTGFQLAGSGQPIITSRVAGYPAGPFAKAVYALGEPFALSPVTDAIAGNPTTAPVLGSGGAATQITLGSGARLTGRASIPQAAATKIDMTQAWTVWAAMLVTPGTGPVWTLLQDANYANRHGFMVFAQSGGAVSAGDQIGISVRMTNDGTDDFGAAYNLAIPPNANFTYGQWLLISITNDGAGNITAQVWASNGKVVQATKSMTIDKGRGPVGSKTNDTRWAVGGLGYAMPGIDVESWGVLQRQWTDRDALIAYRAARALALFRGRAWT